MMKSSNLICVFYCAVAVSTLFVGVTGGVINHDQDIDATGTTGMTSDDTSATETTPFTGNTMEPDSTTAGDMTTDITGSSSSDITSQQPSSSTTASSMTPSSQPMSSTTTQAPSKSGFDGGSFAGGIALGVGLVLLSFLAYKCYISRSGQNSYKAM